MKFDTNIGNIISGAVTGAAAGYFLGKGEKKVEQGAMVGALVVLAGPAVKGLLDPIIGKIGG